MSSPSNKSLVTSRVGVLAGAAAIAAAATAIWVERRARHAERAHPPTGKFVQVDDVALHYVERGEGPPVVLIHGNTVTLADFEASGLIDRLARQHRVIAFDRPGFGHSTRPRDRFWTPTAQADLLRQALQRLNVDKPVVLGHSMGTMVALALALEHPSDVSGLVLLSGYYYPTVRVDALLTAPVALPVLGDVLRYTVTALTSRALLKRVVKTMFAPDDVPKGFFDVLVREILVRPVQLRANAEDAAFMMPEANSASARYGELRMPVSILAGGQDKVVDVDAHARRLHREVSQSSLVILPGAGHMVHYAGSDHVVAAVEKAESTH